MARTVSVRVSFSSDIGFLNRLVQAIEKDERMLAQEKRESMLALMRVAEIFGKVDQRRLKAVSND